MDERRVAIDSCVLVNFLTNGAGDAPDMFPASRRVLKAAEHGDFRAVASALTLAEIAGAGSVRGDQIPRAERQRRIGKVRDWLQDTRRWRFVELDSRIGRASAELAIDHQLKGPDAVILGSALAAKAQTLVTWDNDLLKLNGKLGTQIEIVTPSDFHLDQAAFDLE